MTRKQANLLILKEIKKLVERYPDQRFGQIMLNYVMPTFFPDDPFFAESTETLRKFLGPHDR